MSQVSEFFGEDGPLAKKFPGYKPRPGQISLAKSIYDAIADKQHLLSEAGTGVGKSLAYLVPAIFHILDPKSKLVNKRVLVVTSSKVLQEQLVRKDLPILADLFLGIFPNSPLKYQLVKGTNNYLCLHMLQEAKDKELDSSPEFKEVMEWAEHTNTGDMGELTNEPPPHVWRELSVTGEDCLKKKCPVYKHCHALAWRRRPGHVAVTNYHMFFLNALAGYQILPDADVVVFDEAHKAVEIARNFQGMDLFLGKFTWWLPRRLKSLDSEFVYAAAKNVEYAAQKFFKSLEDYRKNKNSSKFLTEPFGHSEGLEEALNAAAKAAKLAIGSIASTEETDIAKAEIVLKQVLAIRDSVHELAHGEIPEPELVVESSTQPEQGTLLPEEPERFKPGTVYYIEQDRDRGVGVKSTVIDIQKFFRESVLEHYTLVGVSATLTAGDSFDFIAKDMGLQNGEYTCSIAPSPFDPGRVLFMVPNDIPAPNEYPKEHSAAVARMVVDAAKRLKGRTLGLFTSYQNLTAAANLARAELKDINVMVQGEMGKSAILNQFRNNSDCLVLGTSSFWEGVDIPGKNLTCLVIDKIPFVPPDDPVIWYLDNVMGKGRETFMANSIPRACIALKQGVGRLIRTEADYGVIMIGDRRIITKPYGKRIMMVAPHNSTDWCYAETDSSTTECLDHMEDFLQRYDG